MFNESLLTPHGSLQNGSINVRNVFGGAETLETNISFGTRTSSAFQFCLAKPINASPNARVDVNAFNLVRNNTLFSSHEESLQGGGIRLKVGFVFCFCLEFFFL